VELLQVLVLDLPQQEQALVEHLVEAMVYVQVVWEHLAVVRGEVAEESWVLRAYLEE
jgi:hypothetical protein